MRQGDLETIKDSYSFFIDQFDRLPPPATLDEDYCRLLAQASSHHRRLAIAILLSDANRSGFADHLRASGRLRVALLQGAACQPGSYVQWERQGLVAPFFDAWTAGAEDIAHRIAELSQLPHQVNYEYIEDYQYARWWYGVALANWQLTDDLAGRLDELSEATADDVNPRLIACRALTAGDGAKFDVAMKALSRQHIEWYEERTAEPFENSTEGFVSIEGLALLRLARKIGIAITNEYPRVPGSIALGI
jgi:hypothetical protein